MYVLDSSALIEVLEEGKYAPDILELLQDSPLVTTSICVYELLQGSISEKDRFVLEGIFSATQILPHDLASAKAGSRIQDQLTKQGAKINQMDVLIAGICKVHNAELVTLDRDFEKIKNIKVNVIK